MPFKIQNGTPKSGKSLCYSCKHARTVRGQNCEEVTTCNAGIFGGNLAGGGNRNHYWTELYPGQVPFKVEQCSSYADMNTPSLEDMKQIAWEVTARKRGSAGFGDGVTNPDELETVITPPQKSSKPEITWKN